MIQQTLSYNSIELGISFSIKLNDIQKATSLFEIKFSEQLKLLDCSITNMISAALKKKTLKKIDLNHQRYLTKDLAKVNDICTHLLINHYISTPDLHQIYTMIDNSRFAQDLTHLQTPFTAPASIPYQDEDTILLLPNIWQAKPLGIPRVIIFDLDETLFQVTAQTQREELSATAKLALGPYIENCELLTGFKAKRVQTIAYAKVKTALDQAYRAISEHKHHQYLSIKIITTASYSERCIKVVFDKLFADGDQRFSTNQFPIEYFNRYHLGSIPLIHDVHTSSGLLDPRKGELICKKFPQWQDQMPGLEEKNVILIDNADYNTTYVERIGFSAILYPTTLKEQDSGRNFNAEAQVIFQRIYTWIAQSYPVQ